MTADHASPSLDGLALETLQQIAGHLHATHRPSLYAFGLANDKCHRATLAETFREIHLTIHNRQRLQRDVDALVQVLSRTDSFRHVRHLQIKGFLRLNAGGPDASDSEVQMPDDDPPEIACLKEIGIGEILPDEEVFFGARYVCHHNEPVIETASEEDVAWAPAARLIRTLPHLTTLVYDCRNQFPPSLLDTLHERHPQCKLHHLTLRLPSLLWDAPHPYEMALATSPCLYAVKAACGKRDSNGDDYFNQEAVMELVAGLAPNLKEVFVVNVRPAYSRKFPQLRAPWKSLPGSVPGSGVGSLTSLSLVGGIRWTPHLLQPWAKHTDFLNLRHLALGGGYSFSRGFENGMTDEQVEWIVQNCSFPRLRTLRIRLSRGDMYFEMSDYADNVAALFRILQPLEELSVFGQLEVKILDAILSRHGPALKKLDLCHEDPEYNVSAIRDERSIPMSFEKKHVLRIQEACPALEQLAIPVKRTKSDAVEAEIYKSFGKMENLRSLFIILDCSEWRLTRDYTYQPSFDGPDDETCESMWGIKKGHLRDTFMNCAVDETLARSIWKTICQHKLGRQLRSLKLWTTGGGKFGQYSSDSYHSDIVDIVNNLSRAWLIELDVGDEVDVKEIGRRAREMRDHKLHGLYNLGKPFEESEVVQIFRRIWPRKEGSEDWREDWSSLPLQV